MSAAVGFERRGHVEISTKVLSPYKALRGVGAQGYDT